MEVYPKHSDSLGPEELSKFSSRPILNLITTVRSRYAADAIAQVKHRLSRESTVLVSGYGLGLVDKIFDRHYPDSKSRPTFYRLLTGQRVWAAPGHESQTEHKDDLASVMKQQRPKKTGFRVNIGALGQRLRIGPLELRNVAENPGSLREREKRTRYLINLLLRAPFLSDGGNEIPRELMLYLCFTKLLSKSVLGPLAVMRECRNGELFADAAGREIGTSLVFEAWNVMRRYLPTLQLSQALDWVTKEAQKTSKQIHPMLLEVATGIEIDINDLNGWIIEQARRFGIPCDRHERIMAMVKAKAERIKKEVEAVEAAKREKTGISRSRDSERLAEPLDKVEVKRMKKAEAQSKNLGHQTMPDHYSSPNIQPLGKRGT
jgi:2-dehydropantoate 2-reductase